MKQIYVRPEAEEIRAELISMVCASKERITVKPNAYWGENVDQNEHSNNAWINEQQTTANVGYSEGSVVPVAGDDAWDIPSRSNPSLWED